ncbi:MAG: 16S rRNA (cytosine(1402)-N(4))-methyltransferase [Chloroflexi bacterium RBG_16_68_14]|nr:MAG: 16S rRNA (cytosine(1402)-N(4))-methyltransferase [Chloroflexi bacterium RBG_16_68_14]
MSTATLTDHAPVMVREVLAALNVRPGGRYVDGTVGGGGHALAIMEAATPGGSLLGIDRDPQALEMARRRLEPFGPDARLVQGDFADLGRICRELAFVPVHGVLLDLGLSSLQLEAAERGFSFQREGPLDMRFDRQQMLTAAEIVNEYAEEALADVLWRYGEEPQARRIARRIGERRPLHTTTELAKVVEEAVGGRARRQSHPATRTFQALRIAVNQELLSLEAALPQAYGLLGDFGRLVVLSYHSLEDRLVKAFIRRESQDCFCPPRQPICTCGHKAGLRRVSRGAVRPSPEEVARNPRSRSARLRVAERLPAAAG